MNERSIATIFFLFFIIVASLGFRTLPGPYGDNGRYIVLAKSLLQGKGLKLINFPDEPAEKKIPPLYPAILAFLILVFGYNIFILKISSLVFMGLALFFFYLFLRKIKLPPAIRLSALFLVCTSPYSWEYCREVLSEAPFIFLVALTAFFLAVYEEEKPKNFIYVAIFSASCAALVRDVGMLMLVAIAVILLKQKEYRRLAMVMAILVFLAGAWLYKNLHSQGGYLKEFISQGNYIAPSDQMLSVNGFLRRYAYESAAYLGDILPDYILPAYKVIIPHSRLWLIKIISGLLFFSIIGYGILLLRKRQKCEFVFWFALFYALCLPLFATYGLRYIIPIGFFLFLGLTFGLSQISLFKNKIVVIGLFVLVLVFNLRTEAKQIVYIRQGYPGQWANYYKALFYLKDKTDKQVVLICRQPFLGYLLSERKTLGYPYTSDPGKMFQYIRDSQASYVIIDAFSIADTFFSQKYLVPVIKKYTGAFSRVYQVQEPLTEVYRIIR